MFRALLILFIALVPALAQDVRITEFLPVNTTGLQDQDLTPQPWIELWNPNQTTKAVLTGWKLSHNGVTWNFPTGIEIPPGEFMVVFAGGKNRTTVTAPLHTSFSLSPTGGGPLQLLRTDNSIASIILSYPALPANVSFGRDLADNNQLGSYTNPSPGSANNYTGSGVAGKVAFSVASCAYTQSFTVTLSQVTPAANAQIRYTTNGTTPISSSPLYSTPISVTGTVQIRARVFESGKLPGETEGEAYLRLDGTTTSFSTATPLIVICNFGLGEIPNDGDQAAFMWVWEPGADGRSRFSNPPSLVTRVAVDQRGSSTLENPKWNLNLEARKDRDDEDKDIELLGMGNGSDWVFHAPYNFDRSLIHNPLMYAMSNMIGRVAMRNRMAEVFIEVTAGTLNYTGGQSGDYFGLYNVMQKIRRGGDRIDIPSLGMYDNDPVTRTGGYIMKVDRLDSGDSGVTVGVGTGGQQNLVYYYPKEVDIKSAQRDPQEQTIVSYYNSFLTALYGANWTNPQTGYAAYLDVPAAIDHHLMNIWSFNVDALRLSGYMHKDRGGKIVYGPLWDFDRALSSTDGRDSNPSVWRSQSSPDAGTDFFNFSWWNRLFNHIDFYQQYIDRWVELRRGAFSPASINALIDSLNAELTAEGVTRDLARWGQTKRSWTSPFNGVFFPANQAAEIQRIKDYLQQRANFFETQWVRPVQFSQDGGSIALGSTVTLSKDPLSPAGTIVYYTLDGSDPRPSGGAAPTAGNVFAYTGPITINGITRIKARAYHASFTAQTGANNPPLVSKWSGLRDVRFAIHPAAAPLDLAVTEVNYHPADPTPEELAADATFEDSDFEFVELRNISPSAVDLAGVNVSGAIDYTFTNDSALTLQPGEFVIIAANPAALAARYGAVQRVVGPFDRNLNNSEDQLVVRSAANAVLSSFTYSDEWYGSTDGGGRSLEASTNDQTQLSLKAGWHASYRLGGSPGFEDIPPQITQGPVDKTVNPGTLVTFEVTATGLPAPTYQWRKNFEPIADATGPSYTIETPVEGDEGVYDVVVQNVAGQVTSTPGATLAVNDPIVFTTHPEGGTVNPDTPVTFTAAVTGTQPITFQWRKNGEPLSGETGASLSFTANEGSEGSYDVVATNIVAPVESNAAVLVVNDPVVITGQPEGGTLNPDGTITLTVTVTGTAPLTYQWRKGGAPIENATGSQFVLSQITEEAEGTYDVLVTNIVGTVESEDVVVSVNDPVQITADPIPLQVKLGGRAEFAVSATGTAPFTYQWRRNNTPIDAATGPVYTINAVTEADLGTYDVLVGNLVGTQESATAELSLLDLQLAAGTYQGTLVVPGASDPEDEPVTGRLTATVSTKGAVTGKVEYQGLAHPFRSTLDLQLKGTATVPRRGETALEVAFYLNGVDAQVEAIAAPVGTPEAQRPAAVARQIPKRSRTAPAPRAGRYTALIEPGAGYPVSPAPAGFVTMAVSTTGATTWSGKLSDSTALRGSALLPANDRIAFYSGLYGSRRPQAGYIAGELAIEAADVTGTLFWKKPLQLKGTYFPGGFRANTTFVGSPWVAPARTAPIFTPGTLAFFVENELSGNIDPFAVNFTTQSKFVFPAVSPRKPKLSISRTTGLITGSFFDTFFRKTRQLSGVYLQNANHGEGLAPGAAKVLRWELEQP